LVRESRGDSRTGKTFYHQNSGGKRVKGKEVNLPARQIMQDLQTRHSWNADAARNHQRGGESKKAPKNKKKKTRTSRKKKKEENRWFSIKSSRQKKEGKF